MTKNRYYRITRNHGNEMPSHVISIGADYENAADMRSCHLARACGISERRKKSGWYGRQEATFNSGVELWEWVRRRSRPRESTWVYAHCCHAIAVVSGFWQELDSGRFRLGLPMRQVQGEDGSAKKIKAWNGLLAIESRPFCAFVVCGRGTIKFCDITNLYDIDIVTLWESFVDQRRREPIERAADGASALDAKATAETVHIAITKTIDAWADGERGNWQPTAGRLAYSNYRHEFMPDHSIDIDEKLMDREFHREACFGGENQYWYRGIYNEPVYKIDVTGLYPAVMRGGSFPYRIDEHCPPDETIKKYGPSRPADCIARVQVYGIGDLPARSADGVVSYPTGIFYTTLAGPELAFAVEQDRIRQWIGWTQFDCSDLFTRYVDYWWAIRRQAKAVNNAAVDALAKIMLNSLYGVFMKRKSRWTLQPKMSPPIRWGNFASTMPGTAGFQKLRAVAGVAQLFNGLEESEGTFPAIGAFVTSAARLFMRLVRWSLPANSVLLQQTDGLLLTASGYRALSNGDYFASGELGKFRLIEEYKYVNILGSNHWITDKDDKLSGVPADRERIDDWTYQAKSTETSAEFIARKGGDNCLHIKNERYIIKGNTNGRNFGPDGWAYN